MTKTAKKPASRAGSLPDNGDKSRRVKSRASTLRLSATVGLVAAMAVAVLVNILASRHYRRWDWTSAELYTISPITVQTLHSLAEPVQIYVLLSSADPLSMTLRHMLEAYGGETRHLDVRFTDPDSHPAEFLAIQQRFGIVAGKTEGGRIVTDASVIVVRGERHHFITADELVQVDSADDLRARPRIEQTLTDAIRRVRAGTKKRVCFTTGHGEPSTEAGDLIALAGRLAKSNHEVEELPPQSELQGRDPIDGCKLVIVAGPERPLPDADVARLRSYLATGGNLLVAFNPILDDVKRDYVDLNLNSVLSLANIRRRLDLVFELDPDRAHAKGFGEAFIAEVEKHEVTKGLDVATARLPVIITMASSLTTEKKHEVIASPLLKTSEDAFGLVDFYRWSESQEPPEQGEADHPGPLTLAFAAELPKVTKDADNGPRVVVLGSSSALLNPNWQIEQFRGSALFVESTISWLTAEPIMLDIPKRPSQLVGLKVTKDTLSSVLFKSLVLLPGASLLFGVAVLLRRRASKERAGSERDRKKKRS